ncbi:DUF2141 domain-containing protein [Roseomonas elaeocarpi]|uniref:DUF2141 domain-containing protein n=1 Tax=Roseomonas elaeocarpi TaxID=907779 RepID=A0ABV6JQP3_9PROT
MPRSATLAGLLVLLLGTSLLPAQAQETARQIPCNESTQEPRIEVHVAGAHSGKGEIAITIYGDQADRFLAKGGSLARARVPLDGATALDVCFSVSQPGLYAVALYHDENGDKHFNRTMLGLPEEGYGFSNDAAAPMRAPSLKEAAIHVGTGLTRVAVMLRY